MTKDEQVKNDYLSQQEPEPDDFDSDYEPEEEDVDFNNLKKVQPASPDDDPTQSTTPEMSNAYPTQLPDNKSEMERKITEIPISDQKSEKKTNDQPAPKINTANLRRNKPKTREQVRQARNKKKQEDVIKKANLHSPVAKYIVAIIAVDIISLIANQLNVFLVSGIANLLWRFIVIAFTVVYGYSFFACNSASQKTELNNKMRTWYGELYGGDLTKQYELYNGLNQLILVSGLSISLVGGKLMNNQAVAAVVLVVTLYFWFKFRTAIKMHRNPIKLANAVFDIIKDWTHTNKFLFLITELILIYEVVLMLIPNLIADLSNVNWF